MLGLTGGCQNSKLDPKAREFIFVGLSDHGKAWRYWNPRSRQVQTSRNVVFENQPQTNSIEYTVPRPTDSNTPDNVNPPLLEGEKENDKQILGSQTISDSDPIIPETHRKAPVEQSTSPPAPSRSRVAKLPPPPRERSSRIAELPAHNYRLLNNPQSRVRPTGWELMVPVADEPETPNPSLTSNDNFSLLSNIPSDEPTSHIDALSRHDSTAWHDAMNKEIQQLLSTGTWKLTELPANHKPIKCKWTYKLKRDHTGAITRYKARLVAKGFSQVPGIDFTDTFAPVVRLETFHLLMALAARYQLDIHVMDVIGAYLNGELNETIYMEQPPGYEDGTNRVVNSYVPFTDLNSPELYGTRN